MQIEDFNLCTNPDDPDLLDKVRWEVTLINGLIIYQKSYQCWKNLKLFCENKQLFIKDIVVSLRSNRHRPCPYICTHNAYWEGIGYTEGLQIPYLYFGWTTLDNNGILHCTKWRSPTLELLGIETRKVSDYTSVLI